MHKILIYKTEGENHAGEHRIGTETHTQDWCDVPTWGSDGVVKHCEITQYIFYQ